MQRHGIVQSSQSEQSDTVWKKRSVGQLLLIPTIFHSNAGTVLRHVCWSPRKNKSGKSRYQYYAGDNSYTFRTKSSRPKSAKAPHTLQSSGSANKNLLKTPQIAVLPGSSLSRKWKAPLASVITATFECSISTRLVPLSANEWTYTFLWSIHYRFCVKYQQ